MSYAYRFDAATASPDGRFAVIYDKAGNERALCSIMDGFIRELDRSFYHAAAYEYPVVLFNDPDGRALLAHCPGNYCRIEFEDAETGRPAYRISRSQAVGFFPFAVGSEPPGESGYSAPGGCGIR